MFWRAAVWFALLARLALAEESGDRLTRAGIKEFTAAYANWDAAGFAAAASLFRQAAANPPASCANDYWLGVAQFHRLLQLQSLPASRTNLLAAAAAMDDALAALEAAVSLDERHAESHALLGALYGMKIDGSLWRAARFGPRVAKHQKRALEFGPENPRVRYLLGACQFHTAKSPAARQEALATLLLAEQLYEAEARRAPGPLEPRWGLSSCLTFIGRTYELLGRHPQAAGYFRKALALHPADHLAKAGLARAEQK
jgi:tetratricopeptide (TPR) repeat protein